jgi:hypothetical protein
LEPHRFAATVSTAIIGAISLVHAIAITILALTLPTGTFLAVYRLVGLPIIAAGLRGSGPCLMLCGGAAGVGGSGSAAPHLAATNR